MAKDNTIVFEAKKNGKSAKIVLIIVLAFACVILAASTFVVVPAGHTGVVVTLGRVSEGVKSSGLHVKAPFIQKIEKISNKIQKEEVVAEAVSKDLQAVSSEVAVNYRVGPLDAANIFKNIGRDYQSVVLLPAVQESVKSVSAKYTAEELITKRTQVGQEIKETLAEKVEDYGIIIDRFNIVNFEFSPEFNNAIEAKQVAEQNLIKTKTEQEQAIVIAEAEAKKQVITAEAEAKAIMARAQAQADANKLLDESLNSNLLEYQKIQKWDGKLPTVTGGSALIDIGAGN